MYKTEGVRTHTMFAAKFGDTLFNFLTDITI